MNAERLALDGGIPVRRTPLPIRFFGTRWIGEEEKREVIYRSSENVVD